MAISSGPVQRVNQASLQLIRRTLFDAISSAKAVARGVLIWREILVGGACSPSNVVGRVDISLLDNMCFGQVRILGNVQHGLIKAGALWIVVSIDGAAWKPPRCCRERS